MPLIILIICGAILFGCALLIGPLIGLIVVFSKALVVIAPAIIVWVLFVFAKAVCSGGASSSSAAE